MMLPQSQQVTYPLGRVVALMIRWQTVSARPSSRTRSARTRWTVFMPRTVGWTEQDPPCPLTRIHFPSNGGVLVHTRQRRNGSSWTVMFGDQEGDQELKVSTVVSPIRTQSES